MDIKALVDSIVDDGVMTLDEHDELMELMHADGEIDEEESAQISRIFKLLQSGELRVVDEERDHYQSLRAKEDAEEKTTEEEAQATAESEAAQADEEIDLAAEAIDEDQAA